MILDLSMAAADNYHRGLVPLQLVLYFIYNSFHNMEKGKIFTNSVCTYNCTNFQELLPALFALSPHKSNYLLAIICSIDDVFIAATTK